MRSFAICLVLLSILAPSARAQSSREVRDSVRAFIVAYTDAANRADPAAYAGMYDETPDLIVINNGEIKRGWNSIRDEANQILGYEGSFRISTGIVDVMVIDSLHAVATFPYVMTLQTTQGPQQLRGASTMVVERRSSRWFIVHDHMSTVPAPGS